MTDDPMRDALPIMDGGLAPVHSEAAWCTAPGAPYVLYALAWAASASLAGWGHVAARGGAVPQLRRGGP